MPKKLFLIDGSNHAFRVQFALPPMNASDGFPTRALYGFTTLFAKILRVHEPDYVVVSFDKGKTFRHDMFPDYKGHRPDMPEDLAAQWPHFPRLVEAFGYPCLSVPGFEADDVLGTLASRFASDDLKVYLVTGDKDFCQLVNDHVVVLDLMKDKEIDAEGVEAQWGVGPDRVVDILGLAGDSSDNIPGIPGIGPKKAQTYVNRFGSLEGVLEHADDVGGKTGQKIKDHAEDARISKQLATIHRDVPLDLDLEDLAPRGLQEDELRELFDIWEFGPVARKLLPERPAVDPSTWRAVSTLADLDDLVATLRDAGGFAFDLETSQHDDPAATLLGIGVGWGRDQTAYVPLDSRFDVGFTPEQAVERIKALLEDPSVGKTAHDAKLAWHVCRHNGVSLAGITGDVVLADYLLAPHESHDLPGLCERYLGHTLEALGAIQTLFQDAVTLDETMRSVCERTNVVWLLHHKLTRRMADGPRAVYTDIEVPLLPLLAEMEAVGIGMDLERFEAVKRDVADRVAAAEKACHDALGREFNVNSTKDLREILFEELGLTPGKKTKSGYSTDASVLEKLVDEHPLPGRLLEYRKLQKLLSTYLEPLPGFIAADGRIHSSFNQAVAATGRLSSNNPNLQNIPIRTFEGRRIRDCFVPADGCVFLSADYSQVELRILAHFCGEGALIESFRSGEDIHRRTASEVFGVPLDQVTDDHRSAAKAINFGLLYGMSAFRLAGDLHIPRSEAQQYMEDYFGRLPAVKAWIEDTKESARKLGYVETLFGRRRLIRNIHSKQYNERAAAEREAVNTCVQGTAADVIKRAMIRVGQALSDADSEARVVLQVHDELLLEVPRGEIDGVTELVVREMMGAADLAVPLRVNTAVGATWNEAHG